MKKIIFLLLPILCLAKNLTLEHRINPPNRELMDVEIFGDTEDQQDNAILAIKQGLVDHSFVAEAEINLSATLIKLARIHNN